MIAALSEIGPPQVRSRPGTSLESAVAGSYRSSQGNADADVKTLKAAGARRCLGRAGRAETWVARGSAGP